MTQEERAYNYASTQKPTKLQVGEIAKHYNNGYNQAMQDFLEKAITYLAPITYTHPHLIDLDKFKQAIETYGRSKV